VYLNPVILLRKTKYEFLRLCGSITLRWNNSEVEAAYTSSNMTIKLNTVPGS
jgi:hypothetical protein